MDLSLLGKLHGWDPGIEPRILQCKSHVPPIMITHPADKFSCQLIIDQQTRSSELRKPLSFLFLPEQNNVQIHSDHA